MAEIRIKFRDLGTPIYVRTNEQHTIVVEFPRLVLRLAIDPDHPGHEGDRFILKSIGASAIPDQIKTIKDDQRAGNGCLDLVFNMMRPGRKYSLFCEPGDGGPSYAVFENMAFSELF